MNTEMIEFIAQYKDAVAKRPLMHGATLDAVEALWHSLSVIEEFARTGVNVFNGPPVKPNLRMAYEKVASKYKCGCWVISAKVSHDMGENTEAATELIRRLREVDQTYAEMRANES